MNRKLPTGIGSARGNSAVLPSAVKKSCSLSLPQSTPRNHDQVSHVSNTSIMQLLHADYIQGRAYPFYHVSYINSLPADVT